MIESMVSETWIIAAAVGGAMLVGYICYVSAYINHKKEKALAEQMARTRGEVYPQFEVDKVSRWFHGYTLALVIEIVLAAFLGCLAVTVVSGEIALSLNTKVVSAFVASVVYGLFVDRYIIHPIADGQFYERVEKPLIEQFLYPDQDTDAIPSLTIDGDLRDTVKRAVAELLSDLIEKKK